MGDDHWIDPRAADELKDLQRVGQIVLGGIKGDDKPEAIDWQVARAVIADREALVISWRETSGEEHDHHLHTVRLKDRYQTRDRAQLQRLVDVVWKHATESTAVPASPTADMLIKRLIE